MNGPVREARFKFVDPPTNSIRSGGVQDLFVITGRTDAGTCNIAQPAFAAAVAQNNVIFRIPTPTFGLGLVESIRDSTILANKTNPALVAARMALGISGHEDREGNAGTITRFGWKAQNKSLTIFSGEAYNVEQGISNELFPQERDETPNCVFTSQPEDHVSFAPGPTKDSNFDMVAFANFMRFLAAPTPVSSYGSVTAASINNGRALFTSNSVGCALCHTQTFKPDFHRSLRSPINRPTSSRIYWFIAWGSGLADDIIQGDAGPEEFRTAPLWGLERESSSSMMAGRQIV